MKLYIVSKEEYDYDEYISHVIASNTTDEAIALAMEADIDNMLTPPPMPVIWKTEEIGTYLGEIPNIVHSSFMHG